MIQMKTLKEELNQDQIMIKYTKFNFKSILPIGTHVSWVYV